MNFSMWHSHRFMIRGFEQQPFFGEPYNPPHYPAHFERFGFLPLIRYHSWDLDAEQLRACAERYLSLAARFPEVHEDYESEPLRLDRFGDEVVRVHEVLNESFRGSLGYSSIDVDEFQGVIDGYETFMIPELTAVITGPDGEAVGYLDTYPDISPKLRAARRGAAGSPESERVILHTVALKKSHRRKRLVETFVGPVLQASVDRGFPRAIGALTREGPTIFDTVATATREYCLYSYDAGA
jgi:hypothetical protein